MNRALAMLAGSFFLLAGIYDCYDSERKGKRRLKPFLMPLLTVFYVSSADEISLLVTAGLLLGGLGDTLLIHKQNKKALLGGTAAFLAGHLCYVLRFLHDCRWGIFPEWIIPAEASGHCLYDRSARYEHPCVSEIEYRGRSWPSSGLAGITMLCGLGYDSFVFYLCEGKPSRSHGNLSCCTGSDRDWLSSCLNSCDILECKEYHQKREGA